MPVEIKIIKEIEREFNISPVRIKKIIRDFHRQMRAGLAGRKSCLEMLPAFVDSPSGREKGRFIALDLGGTNFRLLELELKGNGKIGKIGEKKFALGKKHISGSAAGLFGFIAGCIRSFSYGEHIPSAEKRTIGFTFSFPVRQTGVASGRLMYWVKGFSAKGAVGRDVVALLNASLAQQKVNNIKVAALANDTVGTLVARAYADRACDIGLILGTGTNACYREKIGNIAKYKGAAPAGGQMIVNTEWGNFNLIDANAYDRSLDRNSANPGCHILEKMISGMYLGELCRLVMLDLAQKGLLFAGKFPRRLKSAYSFKTEYMSSIAADRTANLSASAALFKKLGVARISGEDLRVVKKTCAFISGRAAFLSAAALAAVALKIDPRLLHGHTVAVDGTVYEKYPGFAGKIRAALKEILGSKAARIKMVLTKDGSGIGAAVIAAVAQGGYVHA